MKELPHSVNEKLKELPHSVKGGSWPVLPLIMLSESCWPTMEYQSSQNFPFVRACGGASACRCSQLRGAPILPGTPGNRVGRLLGAFPPRACTASALPCTALVGASSRAAGDRNGSLDRSSNQPSISRTSKADTDPWREGRRAPPGQSPTAPPLTRPHSHLCVTAQLQCLQYIPISSSVGQTWQFQTSSLA